MQLIETKNLGPINLYNLKIKQLIC